MGRHLDAAKQYASGATAGLLAGGRYALVHTRSLEFDELRPYVPGDDVRDIDWKATARSGHPLVKQFVSEKHHKILVVADAGRNTRAETPSGELKYQLASNIIGAVGLMTLPRSDEIGLVTGDRRGCVDIRLRRGENHVERLLHRYHQQVDDSPAASSIIVQLRWVAQHHRHPLLIFVVADEPDISEPLRDVLQSLRARHDLLWAMVADRPALHPTDPGAGFDVADGRRVLPAGLLGDRVARAYRRAEDVRRRQLSETMTALGIPHARLESSRGIMAALAAMTGVYTRAG